jgi:hypothetical protein
MKTRMALVLAFVAALVFGATKGEKIVADTEFFSKEYSDTVLQMLTIAGGNTTVRLDVPDPQPRVEAIRKKYGKPSKVTEEEPAASIPVAVRVHYYGRIGFAVARNDAEGKVGWLVIR